MSDQSGDSSSNGQSQKPAGSKNKFPKSGMPKINFNFYWIYAILILIIFAVNFMDLGGQSQETNWVRFKNEMLLTHDVERIEIVNRDRVNVFIKKDKLNQDKYKAVAKKAFGETLNEGPHYYFSIGDLGTFEKNMDEVQKDFTDNEKVVMKYKNNERGFFDFFLTWMFPILLLALLWIVMMRRMGGGGGGSQIFNIGKSKATLFDKDMQVKVTFNDVAGLEEAKVEVMEIVDFLKNPKKYTSLGGKIPRGALLVGPPGTGKTLLAKAVAGEAQVPFFSLSGSDFVEMFVGVGASRVRDLFRQAKEKAPAIIFIDEIDAIGRARGKAPSFSAND